jgi:CheY-like chemotaxis protein
MSKVRTLVVDDEAELRKSLRDELLMDGWDVDDAEDGLMALQKMEKQNFDVVIADVRMPNLDGWSLLRKVRTKDLKTIFVIMSAYADTPPWEAYALGADAFFGKPFRISDLEELMRRMSLPMLDRWGDAERQQARWELSDHIDVDVSKHPENFSLGRGGMFISGETQSVRKGGILSFRVTTADLVLEGIGKVRWKRGTQEEGLAPGLGVEFLYLHDSCRSMITQAIAKSKEKAFIPRGTLLK